MSSHVYHDKLEGYDERQIWFDDCPECERRLAAPGWRHCTPCLREYVAGLRRRRGAELRMPPLEVASSMSD